MKAWAAALLVLGAGAALGCGSSDSGAGTGSIDGGGRGGAGGSQASGAGGTSTTGAGGAAAGGSNGGGGSGGGAGGTTGSGGTGTGTGGAAGGGGAGMPPCAVAILPVSSTDFVNLPAGARAKPLRVHGVITGTPPTAPPVWTWKVLFESTGAPVAFTVVPDDPSSIDVPLAMEGIYDIEATVSTSPLCRGQQTAQATTMPSVSYWVRVTAPADQTHEQAIRDLPPHEQAIKVQAKMMTLIQQLPFDQTVNVSIDPRTSANIGVQSYLRISSPTHSWVRESDTTNRHAFVTTLPDSSVNSSLYDLLVVPLAIQGGSPPAAPLLVSQQPAVLLASMAVVDPGITIAGSAADANGPLGGVIVLLRAGPLPSTLGTSGSDGRFSVLARAGRFSAIILPPDGSALPNARVDATASSGIDIPDPPAVAPTLSFSWARVGTRSLTALYASAGGGAAVGMDVRLDSADGALPNVGTLKVGSSSLVATGAVHRRGTTDSSGSIAFTGLPPARYQLTALPAVGSTDGLTTSAVDLTSAQAPTTAMVTLAPKITVRGSLSNAPAGTQIIVLDDQPELARAYPSVALGAGGTFTLALDPSHPFHLLADPPRDKASRVPLGPVATGTAALDLGDSPWPNMVTVSGSVFLYGSQTAVPGALVQAFCLGSGPDCLDYSDLAAKDPLPLAESLVSAKGTYSLFLPDPAAN